MTAIALPERISQSSVKKIKYRTLMTQYGDGYSQRARDGINDAITMWEIQYENVSSADRVTIQAFVAGVGNTDWFTYTAPGDTEKKFVITSEVSEQVKAGDVYSISFSIQQVFDLV